MAPIGQVLRLLQEAIVRFDVYRVTIRSLYRADERLLILVLHLTILLRLQIVIENLMLVA